MKFEKHDEPINLKVLKGEPLDGSGKLCIHFLFETPDGLIDTSGEVPPGLEENPFAKIVLNLHGPRKWRLSCRPEQNTINPQVRNGVRYICLTSNEPLAVTCPDCLQSKDMTEGWVGELIEKQKQPEAAA